MHPVHNAGEAVYQVSPYYLVRQICTAECHLHNSFSPSVNDYRLSNTSPSLHLLHDKTLIVIRCKHMFFHSVTGLIILINSSNADSGEVSQ